MKKKLFNSIFILIFGLLFINTLWAQDNCQPRLITVTGDAQVKVMPDEVDLIMAVETRDKDLKIAKSQNDEYVKKVLAISKEYKIDPKDIQTSHISIQPRYQNYNTRKEDFIGYFVRKSIVLTLKDTSKFEPLLSSVLEAGVNYINNIQFRTSELRKYREQARSMAIKAALDKANNLAKELGQKVGRPYKIDEAQPEYWSPYFQRSTQNQVVSEGDTGEVELGGSSIALGQITVNAKITVSFELE